MKKILRKWSRELSFVMALVIIVTSLGLDSMIVEAADPYVKGTDIETVSDVIGEASLYGIVAGKALIQGHVETNFAVKSLTIEGNSQPGQGPKNPTSTPVFVGNNIVATKEGAGKFLYYENNNNYGTGIIYTTEESKDVIDLSNAHLITVDSTSYSKEQLEGYVDDMISVGAKKSSKILEEHQNKYNNSGRIDITGCGSGTYYFSMSAEQYNGLSVLSFNSDQKMVITITSNEVNLHQLNNVYIDGKDHNVNACDAAIDKALIFNFPYASKININGNQDGVFLAPYAVVNQTAVSGGWILCKEGNFGKSEWHLNSSLPEDKPSIPSVTPEPTATPTVAPTATPTVAPTATPTVAPTATPTVAPTATPTVAPTATPTVAPTATPTVAPTATPTVAPTATPTVAPTATPTVAPTATPTVAPTATPTVAPTPVPTVTPEPTPTPEPVTTTVTFSKKAIMGGNELVGAEITLEALSDVDNYDSDNITVVSGHSVDKLDRVISWISTDEPLVLSGLTDGTYIMKEVAAPSGYKVATEIKFSIVNGLVSRAEDTDSNISINAIVSDPNNIITMIDDATTKVSFDKKSCTVDGISLAGAKLRIYNADETVELTNVYTTNGESELSDDHKSISWVSTGSETPIQFWGLPNGLYVLEEYEAPKSDEYIYQVADPIAFIVKDGIIEYQATGRAEDGSLVYNEPDNWILLVDLGDPIPNEPEPPKNDPPKVDPPKNDPPKVDPPKNDPPKNDPPKVDPPKNNPPANDPPVNPPKTPTKKATVTINDNKTPLASDVTKAGNVNTGNLTGDEFANDGFVYAVLSLMAALSLIGAALLGRKKEN